MLYGLIRALLPRLQAALLTVRSQIPRSARDDSTSAAHYCHSRDFLIRDIFEVFCRLLCGVAVFGAAKLLLGRCGALDDALARSFIPSQAFEHGCTHF